MTNIAAMESPRSRYTMRHVVRAELTKLTSLRSTIWMLLVTFAGSVVVTILSTNSVTHHDPAWYQGFDPTNQAMGGLVLAMLTVGILGALAATGEYGSGTIRASLAATPRRRLFLAGKAVVVGGIVLVVGEVLAFVCFGVGQAILGSGGAPTASLGQPGVLQALLLSGAFLALLALMGLGLGVPMRHTAGAISAYVAVTFLIPVLLNRLPSNPARFTPVPILANSIAAVVRNPGQVSIGLGMLLMLLYCGTALALAAFSIVGRDA